MSVIKSFVSFFRSSVVYSSIAVISLSVFCLIFLLQIYLRNEYVSDLKERTYAIENSLLSSTNKNIEYIIDAFIQIGAEIAINDDLFSNIVRYEATSGTDHEVAKQDLDHSLILLSRYSQWIVDVGIISRNGLVYQYDRLGYDTNDLWSEADNVLLRSWYNQIQRILAEEVIPRYYISPLPLSHSIHRDIGLIHIIYPLKGEKSFRETDYAISVSFNNRAIEDTLNIINAESRTIAEGFITDGNNQILYHNNKELIGWSTDVSMTRQEDISLISEVTGSTGMTLNIAIDEGKLLHQMNAINYRGVVFYIFIFIVVSIFMIMLFRAVKHPVNEIASSIGKLKAGNFDSEIPIEGMNEIWKLAEEYNNMIASLKEMNRKVYEYNREAIESLERKQEAERKALDSQINSHFLLNTLNCINYDAIESGNLRISHQIKNLSNILRYSLYHDRNVTLKDEIDWVEQYLFLQKNRHGELFDYSIDVDWSVLDWPCCKLMLQPFVENSIIHGFGGYEKGGMIRITGTKSEEKLFLEISDNGRGMEEAGMTRIERILADPMGTDEKDRGIGISNAVMRIRLYYGENGRISLKKESGGGIAFEFSLPLPAEGEVSA